MGLLDRNQKNKNEVDYGLEKLIQKAERLPIYFNWYDFHLRGTLQKGLISLENKNYSSRYMEYTEINKMQRLLRPLIDELDFRRLDIIRKVNKTFDPVLKKMERDLLNDRNPHKVKIAAEYHRAEKILYDLQKRNEYWADVGVEMLCSEYNIKKTDLDFCLYVTFDEATYNNDEKAEKEKFLRKVEDLRSLEREYAKYNDNKGLIALDKALEKIDYWERFHHENAAKKLKDQQQRKDILSGNYKSGEELAEIVHYKLDESCKKAEKLIKYYKSPLYEIILGPPRYPTRRLNKVVKLFDSELDNLREDLINATSVERTEQIYKEIIKAEQIKADYQRRIELWYELGNATFDSERRFITGYSQENQQKYNELHRLEGIYSQYNKGEGFSYLEKIRIKLRLSPTEEQIVARHTCKPEPKISLEEHLERVVKESTQLNSKTKQQHQENNAITSRLQVSSLQRGGER